ncbi:hypothetical protein I4U23_015196 [Adineta vaga]|nr:hypothetical protein I4U23_015196 [Adineta vaga]
MAIKAHKGKTEAIVAAAGVKVPFDNDDKLHGCRHYIMHDIRIDPQGEPWFLEAGLYCSFGYGSGIPHIVKAAGITLDELFAMMMTHVDVSDFLSSLKSINIYDRLKILGLKTTDLQSKCGGLAKALELAQALSPFNSETVQDSLENTQMLSDKYLFADRIHSLGLTTPKTYKIINPQQVLDFDFSKERSQFILKSILGNNITRWDLLKLPCQTRQQKMLMLIV